MDAQEQPAPTIGQPVPTACGSRVQYSETTPSALLNGRVIYFCLQCCKDDFDANPRSSCAAGLLGA
ncbi:MAG: hypothetical protein ACKOC5_14855 [Chloroflexota bacterium]